jgi:uncharacterized SAM-binding protein YcdF (DUF218 family)
MVKKTAKLRLITLAIYASLLGGAAGLLSKVGPWLAVSDPIPARIDVIFTFGGENIRISYSRDLMRRFPQAHWVISDYGHRYTRLLERQGFDMSRITILDTCRYTISEVKRLADWLKRQSVAPPNHADGVNPADPQSQAALTMRPLHIALVSNPLHMRRIKLIAEKTFRDPAILLHCLPVPAERYGWTRHSIGRWWETRTLRTWVWLETAKIITFWALFSWR